MSNALTDWRQSWKNFSDCLVCYPEFGIVLLYFAFKFRLFVSL